MNIDEAKILALHEMRQHGLLADGWTFTWDQSKRRAGACKYTTKRISLSKPLTQLWSEAAVHDTILHEIAHALVGAAAAHGPVWKAKALEIGCNGNARYQTTDDTPSVPGSWMAVCSAGHVHYRHTRPTGRRKFSCAQCSRRFDPENVLTFERVEPVQTAVALAASMPAASGTKHCAACDTTKPLSDFYNGKARCKPCYREYAAVWRAARKN